MELAVWQHRDLAIQLDDAGARLVDVSIDFDKTVGRPVEDRIDRAINDVATDLWKVVRGLADLTDEVRMAPVRRQAPPSRVVDALNRLNEHRLPGVRPRGLGL